MNKKVIRIHNEKVALEKERQEIDWRLIGLKAELKKIQEDCNHEFEMPYKDDGFGPTGIAPDPRDKYYKCKKCGKKTRRLLNITK